MIEGIKFAMAMANELNRTNFNIGAIPQNAEYALAEAVEGEQCGGANLLADVYSRVTKTQYSMKTYKDNTVSSNWSYEPIIRNYTDFIFERRISGVNDPNGDTNQVFKEVIDDVYQNEQRSLLKYNVDITKTILLGYSEDINNYYFRLTEYDFNYPLPDYTTEKQFTEKSSNFQKHQSNRSSVQGYINDVMVYEWVHPNCQTFTRCLKKKYSLSDHESFYFKINKLDYQRPSDDFLLSIINTL